MIEQVIDCKDKQNLHKRERYYIESLKAELNKYIPLRTYKEWNTEYRQLKTLKIAEQTKEYGQLNKEKISEYRQEYAQLNKLKIAEQKKEYRQLNNLKIAEQKKEYRQSNNEKIQEKNKEYGQLNKLKIAEQKKEYRQFNKEKIQEKKKENDMNNKERKKEYYINNKDKIYRNFESVMHTFVNILEEKDTYTAGHSKRVAEYILEESQERWVAVMKILILFTELVIYMTLVR